MIKDRIRSKYAEGAGGHVEEARYFYYETSPFYNKQLAVVCGGHEKCAADFDINRQNYPYYFVKLTTKGRGTLEINDQTHTLKRGVLSGFSPRTPHHYRSDTDTPMEHIFITFVGHEARELMEISGLSERRVTEVFNHEETIKTMQKMLDIGLEKPAYSQQMICSYLRVILFSQASKTAEANEYSMSMTTYLRCKRYIDGNFSEIKSAGQAADACRINVRYMSSLFKRYNQTNPQSYIMQMKMNKAANLLLASTLAVKQIAQIVGFDDPYHFSRNFKKFYEISPTDYRNKHLLGKA